MSIIINRKCPESAVVIGDILATYAFDAILSLYKNAICVRGEGEIPFQNIVKELLNKEKEEIELSKIPNLAYKSDGKLILTKRMTIYLSRLKHPLRLLAPEVLKQNGCSRIEASRGCVYSKCSCCGGAEKYNGPGWRPLGLDYNHKRNDKAF